jgi:hypothetical protein
MNMALRWRLAPTRAHSPKSYELRDGDIVVIKAQEHRDRFGWFYYGMHSSVRVNSGGIAGVPLEDVKREALKFARTHYKPD